VHKPHDYAGYSLAMHSLSALASLTRDRRDRGGSETLLLSHQCDLHALTC